MNPLSLREILQDFCQLDQPQDDMLVHYDERKSETNLCKLLAWGFATIHISSNRFTYLLPPQAMPFCSPSPLITDVLQVISMLTHAGPLATTHPAVQPSRPDEHPW